MWLNSAAWFADALPWWCTEASGMEMGESRIVGCRPKTLEQHYHGKATDRRQSDPFSPRTEIQPSDK